MDLFPFFVRDRLDLSPEQSKEIDDFQKELDEKLDKTLTDAQKKQVREINPFGPGGFAACPLPGQIISKSTLTALKPTAEQKTRLDDLQKEVDAKLDKVLTADQKKQLKEMQAELRQGGPFGGPPGGPPPGGPGGPPRWRRGRPSAWPGRSDRRGIPCSAPTGTVPTSRASPARR